MGWRAPSGALPTAALMNSGFPFQGEPPPQAEAASCPSPAALHPCQGCWGGDLGRSRPDPTALMRSAPPAQRGAGEDPLIWAGTVKTAGVKARVLRSRGCRVMLFRNRLPASWRRHQEGNEEKPQDLTRMERQAGSSSGSSTPHGPPHCPLQPTLPQHTVGFTPAGQRRSGHKHPPAAQRPSSKRAAKCFMLLKKVLAGSPQPPVPSTAPPCSVPCLGRG